MKQLSVTFLLVILVFSSSLVAADAVKTLQMDRPAGVPSFLGYVPDRFIVVLKDDGPLADAKATEANAFRGIAGLDELAQKFAVSRVKRQFDEVNSRMAASIEEQRLARYFKVRLGFVPLMPEADGQIQLKGCCVRHFQGEAVATYVAQTAKGTISIVAAERRPQSLGIHRHSEHEGRRYGHCSFGECNAVVVKTGDYWYYAVGQVSHNHLEGLLAELLD